MKPKLAGLLVLLAAMIFAIALLNNHPAPNVENFTASSVTPTQNPKPTARFSEVILSDDEMIDNSELIAKVKITKLKEKTVRTVVSEPPPDSLAAKNGKKVSINVPIKIFEAEILESLKAPKNPEKIDIVIPDISLADGDVEQAEFDVGDAFLLYLNFNEVHNAYGLISYSQGVFKFQANSDKVKSSSFEKSYKDIKAKIKGKITQE